MVGWFVYTHRVVHYNIHIIQGIGDFFVQGFSSYKVSYAIFQLQKVVSKKHRAKVLTADFPYVVEGKITLVAVVQKSWF